MVFLSKAQLETGLLEQLAELGFARTSDDLIGPDGKQPEREAYDEVVLQGRLADAVARLNPTLPRKRHPDQHTAAVLSLAIALPRKRRGGSGKGKQERLQTANQLTFANIRAVANVATATRPQRP